MSNDDAAQALFIYTTLPDADSAAQLGEALVKERLAACVNIFPGIRSVYEWQGRLEHDEEVVLIAKTTPEQAAAAARRVHELHPYEVPAILQLPVTVMNSAYLEWMRQQTQSEKSGRKAS